MAESVGSEVKLVARHGSIYGLANLLDRAVSFIMIPIYTRFLTPADYGILELIYMTTNVILMVVGLGIQAAVSRFYFDYEGQEGRNKVVSTAFVGYGGIAIVTTLVLLPLTGLMAEHILDSRDLIDYFVVAVLTLGVGMVIPIGASYLRVQLKSIQLTVFMFAKSLLTVGLNIYFLVYAGMGVYGILVASLIAEALFAVIMTVYVLRQTGLHFDTHILKQMVKFGLPLIPSSMSAYVVHASDRYFIKEFANMSLTGLYSLGYKLGMLVSQFVTSPFIQVWNPRRFEHFNRGDAERIYARIFTYFVFFSLFVGMQISILSKDIVQLITTEPFWPAYKVVPIIALSSVIFSFHYHFQVGIVMKKATKYIAYINLSNAAINLVLNFILIRKYDIWGAAYATLICFIYKAIVTYYFSNRFYPIIVEWRRVITLFLTAGALYFVAIQVETGSIYFNIPLKAAVGCLYVVALYFTRFFSDAEKAKLKRVIKTRKLEFD